jgi:hypothetical protein
MARFKLLIAMQQANQRFGNPTQLGDISTAVPLGTTAARTKLVKQPYNQQFALYEVREDGAEQFRCWNRVDPTQISSKAATSKAYGKYYGAVFRLGPKSGPSGTPLVTLWAKEEKRWQLISYDVDPVWDEYRALDTAKAPPPAPTVYTEAPPEMVEATTKFLDAWLVKRDLDEASVYLSAKCGECVKLNLDPGEQPGIAGNTQAQLKSALRRVTVTTGIAKHLDNAIVAA